MRLPIGFEVTLQPGTVTDLRLQQPATPDDIAKAADGKGWVFIGENHATKPHQQMESDIVEALVRRHRNVVVGLEMITRAKQPVLDLWSQSKLKEADFLQQLDWKGQWGYDYSFYRPLLESVRRHKLPLVGLNVPRDWVRAVGRGGYAALTPEQRAELPAEMPLDNADHHAVVASLMGGHPMTGTSGENMYAAQVLWDEGMADTAIKYLAAHPHDRRTVFVVVAGSGHSMYGQGINFRVLRRTGERGVTVQMAQSEGPATVSRSIGDFLYLTKP
jgi:uncharacterized iron-regulated protein